MAAPDPVTLIGLSGVYVVDQTGIMRGGQALGGVTIVPSTTAQLVLSGILVTVCVPPLGRFMCVTLLPHVTSIGKVIGGSAMGELLLTVFFTVRSPVRPGLLTVTQAWLLDESVSVKSDPEAGATTAQLVNGGNGPLPMAWAVMSIGGNTSPAFVARL
jgi:hypothetical protein